MIGLNIFAAFIAGMLSLLPACGPALLPVFLGISLGRRIALAQAAGVFMLGFSLVFIPFGLGLQMITDLLIINRSLMFALAVIILAGFGVCMLLGLSPRFKFNLNSNKIFLLGLTLGLTASSCSAPVFGAILTLGATGEYLWQTLFYLIVFELGMLTPLLLLGLFLDKLQFVNIIGVSRALNTLGALVFIILGLLFVLGLENLAGFGQRTGLINWFVDMNHKLLN